MQIDYVLILSAGKGTRMGEIGKRLPKVLWPVFEKSLLELQYLFAKEFSNNVYINLYYNKDIIHKHIKESSILKNANVIIEEEPLDIGGAIHNFANIVGYKGRLLILNCDQFIMLSAEKIKKFFELAQNADSVLLTYNVYGRDHYNETQVENGRLVGIRSNKEIGADELIQTYTGISIINLSSLVPCQGESKFFDTVANFRNKIVKTLNMEDSVYWDFGTIKRYYRSMFEILDKWRKNDLFILFLKKYKSLNEYNIKGTSYNSQNSNTINLTPYEYKDVKDCIIIKYKGVEIPDLPCIVMDEIIELVDQE